jgi:nucleotide-binding universal stress UspA family protein
MTLSDRFDRVTSLFRGGCMFNTIVLGLDGSESSDRALERATVLAKEQGSTVHVVHVVELAVGRGGGGALHLDEDAIKSKIEQQAQGLVDAGISADVEFRAALAGGPAHVIAEIAEATNADLIVTGTRGHTATVGILVGSVAHRLLHLARCPLLIVPQAVSAGTGSDAAAAATTAG